MRVLALFFISLLTATCFADSGASLYGSGHGVAAAGGCPACSQDITTDCTSLTGWTQDSGTWTVSGDTYYRNGSSWEDDFLRSDTTVSADCQWGWIQAGYQHGTDSYYGVGLRLTGSTGYRYAVRYDVNGGAIIWSGFNGSTWVDDIQSQSVSLSLGDVLAAQVTGTGTDTEIAVWINPVGTCPDDWGAANYTFTNNPTSAADSGTYVAIYEAHGSSITYIDNAAFGD